MEEITKENFQSAVLLSELPVLVDFWAPWCGPCKMTAPVMEQLAEKFEEKLKVVKVNIDTQGELAVQYGIMSIPTVALFVNGEEKNRIIGASPCEEYEQMIQQYI